MEIIEISLHLNFLNTVFLVLTVAALMILYHPLQTWKCWITVTLTGCYCMSLMMFIHARHTQSRKANVSDDFYFHCS